MQRLAGQLEKALAAHLRGKRRHPVPEAGRLAWRWFCALNETRTYHFGGPNPISFAEIEAYARLHRWPLQPHHVDLICKLDRAWLEHSALRTADGRTVARSSGQAITPVAFDAVFG